MLKIQRRVYLFLIISLLSLPVSALTELSGSLEDFLNNIDYGEESGNSWVKPATQIQADFSNVINAFISGEY